MNESAIEVRNLRHVYGDRVALDDVSFTVERGEIYGLLGPNGGGKTTLFKILATLMAPAAGSAAILGNDVRLAAAAVRRRLGVVFQHPSIDGMLTVRENLVCHGNLYGMSGRGLGDRLAEVLDRVGLTNRAGDRVETLSGGLRRRAELAKALLHEPAVLLLDEPSTGLDPGARREFLQYLRELRDRRDVTVVLTTHYLEEAERCDRVAVLDRGRLVAVGSPVELEGRVGGDVVVVHSPNAEALAGRIRERFGCEPVLVDGTLRIERARGHELVRDLVEAFASEVKLVTYGKPTLEDVFVRLTGHRFYTGAEAPDEEES